MKAMMRRWFVTVGFLASLALLLAGCEQFTLDVSSAVSYEWPLAYVKDAVEADFEGAWSEVHFVSVSEVKLVPGLTEIGGRMFGGKLVVKGTTFVDPFGEFLVAPWEFAAGFQAAATPADGFTCEVDIVEGDLIVCDKSGVASRLDEWLGIQWFMMKLINWKVKLEPFGVMVTKDAVVFVAKEV